MSLLTLLLSLPALPAPATNTTIAKIKEILKLRWIYNKIPFFNFFLMRIKIKLILHLKKFI